MERTAGLAQEQLDTLARLKSVAGREGYYQHLTAGVDVPLMFPA